MLNAHYPFSLPVLPYDYAALEPYLDRETVQIHHDKHFQTYIDNLNKALEKYPRYHSWCLKELVEHAAKFPEQIRTAIRNNAGGVYNHDLYFKLLSPQKDQQPQGALFEAIKRDFGSFAAFKEKLSAAALGQFGSGWAYLVSDCKARLCIMTTPNQDTPLTAGLCPLMLIDVWEHAYYLLYQNRRAEYVENFFHLANWRQAEKCYENRLSSCQR